MSYKKFGFQRLLNADRVVAAHPSVSIPSKQTRTTIKPGDFVKLGCLFLSERKGRLAATIRHVWVAVGSATRSIEDGARAFNGLVSERTPGLDAFTVIQFEPHHVFEVFPLKLLRQLNTAREAGAPNA